MIDTEALRGKILDLAIRGKLTEQLSEDGSAEDLYAKIQEEKAQLIKEGKIKKEKALPETTEDEIPFEIPKNWKWCKLGNAFEIVMGQSPNGENINSQAGMEFHQGKIYFGSKYLNKSDKKTTEATKIAKENSVLLCVRAPVGIVNITDREICIGRGLCALTVVMGVELEYLYYYLKTRRKSFELKGTGSTFSAISIDDVKAHVFPLPPLPEQKRIIDKVNCILERVDEIENLQSQYATNVEVLKSKLIDAGIRGKLTQQLPEDGKVEDLYEEIQIGKAKILERRKGREDKKIKAIENNMPFEIPSHWKWIRLGDIGLFKKGPFGSALTKSIFVQKGEDTVKVYEQQHAIKKDSELGIYYITREYFNEKMSGFEVMPGDIIISCAGTIGETYIMPDKIEQGIINQALMRVTLAEGINKKFFQYYFDANLKKSAQKESNGSAIKNIPPFDVLKNWYFPLTSIEEQGRIMGKIDALLNIFD